MMMTSQCERLLEVSSRLWDRTADTEKLRDPYRDSRERGILKSRR